MPNHITNALAVREQYPNLSTLDAARVALSQRQNALLDAFIATGSILAASEQSGINRHSHYDWLATDPSYQERWERARQAYADRLEGRVNQRIFDDQRPNDILLMFRLKELRPEYREGASVSINVGVGVQVGDWQAAVQAARQQPQE